MATYRVRKAGTGFFVLYHGEVTGHFAMLRDAEEDFDEAELAGYFSNGWRLFTERLRKFKNSSRAVSAAEEKELKFMLEALIEAKRNLK